MQEKIKQEIVNQQDLPEHETVKLDPRFVRILVKRKEDQDMIILWSATCGNPKLSHGELSAMAKKIFSFMKPNAPEPNFDDMTKAAIKSFVNQKLGISFIAKQVRLQRSIPAYNDAENGQLFAALAGLYKQFNNIDQGLLPATKQEHLKAVRSIIGQNGTYAHYVEFQLPDNAPVQYPATWQKKNQNYVYPPFQDISVSKMITNNDPEQGGYPEVLTMNDFTADVRLQLTYPKPKPKAIGMDRQVDYLLLSIQVATQNYSFGSELYNVANDTILTNGVEAGRIGRYVSVAEYQGNCAEFDRVRSLRFKEQEFYGLFMKKDQIFADPLEYDTIMEWNAVQIVLLNETQEKQLPMHNLWRINGNSHAGPWAVKKGSQKQELCKDVALGLMATFHYVCGLAKDAYLKDEINGIHALFDEGAPLFTFCDMAFKPKQEVIERSNITKKIRNIAGVNTIAAALPQMVQSVVTKYKHVVSAESISHIFDNPKNPPDYKKPRDLAGYSNTKSFAKNFINAILDAEKGDFYVMKMSDNLYFGYKGEDGIPYTYSLDGKRMECCHDDLDAQDYRDIFTEKWLFENPYLKQLYEEIQKRTLINGRAIYGDFILRIPGLGSGSAGTAEVNGFKMFQIVYVIIAFLHGDWEDPVLKVFRDTVMNQKKANPTTKIRMEDHVDMKNYPTFRHYMTEKIAPKPSMMMGNNFIDFIAFHLGVTLSLESKHEAKDGRSEFMDQYEKGRITMDLLGFDFQNFRIAGRPTQFWAPVLRRKSLLQIILYDSLENKRSTQITKQQGRMSLLQRAYTTVLLGLDPAFEDMVETATVVLNIIATNYALLEHSVQGDGGILEVLREAARAVEDYTGEDILNISPEHFQPSVRTRAKIFLSQEDFDVFDLQWNKADITDMDPLNKIFQGYIRLLNEDMQANLPEDFLMDYQTYESYGFEPTYASANHTTRRIMQPTEEPKNVRNPYKNEKEVLEKYQLALEESAGMVSPLEDDTAYEARVLRYLMLQAQSPVMKHKNNQEKDAARIKEQHNLIKDGAEIAIKDGDPLGPFITRYVQLMKRARLNIPLRKGGELVLQLSSQQMMDAYGRAQGILMGKLKQSACLILGLYEGRIDNHFKRKHAQKKSDYSLMMQIASDLFSRLKVQDGFGHYMHKYTYDPATKEWYDQHESTHTQDFIIGKSETKPSFAAFMRNRNNRDLNAESARFILNFMYDAYKQFDPRIRGIVAETARQIEVPNKPMSWKEVILQIVNDMIILGSASLSSVYDQPGYDKITDWKPHIERSEIKEYAYKRQVHLNRAYRKRFEIHDQADLQVYSERSGYWEVDKNLTVTSYMPRKPTGYYERLSTVHLFDGSKNVEALMSMPLSRELVENAFYRYFATKSKIDVGLLMAYQLTPSRLLKDLGTTWESIKIVIDYDDPELIKDLRENSQILLHLAGRQARMFIRDADEYAMDSVIGLMSAYLCIPATEWDKKTPTQKQDACTTIRSKMRNVNEILTWVQRDVLILQKVDIQKTETQMEIGADLMELMYLVYRSRHFNGVMAEEYGSSILDLRKWLQKSLPYLPRDENVWLLAERMLLFSPKIGPLINVQLDDEQERAIQRAQYYLQLWRRPGVAELADVPECQALFTSIAKGELIREDYRQALRSANTNARDQFKVWLDNLYSQSTLMSEIKNTHYNLIQDALQKQMPCSTLIDRVSELLTLFAVETEITLFDPLNTVAVDQSTVPVTQMVIGARAYGAWTQIKIPTHLVEIPLYPYSSRGLYTTALFKTLKVCRLPRITIDYFEQFGFSPRREAVMVPIQYKQRVHQQIMNELRNYSKSKGMDLNHFIKTRWNETSDELDRQVKKLAEEARRQGLPSKEDWLEDWDAEDDPDEIILKESSPGRVVYQQRSMKTLGDEEDQAPPPSDAEDPGADYAGDKESEPEAQAQNAPGGINLGLQHFFEKQQRKRKAKKGKVLFEGNLAQFQNAGRRNPPLEYGQMDTPAFPNRPQPVRGPLGEQFGIIRKYYAVPNPGVDIIEYINDFKIREARFDPYELEQMNPQDAVLLCDTPEEVRELLCLIPGRRPALQHGIDTSGTYFSDTIHYHNAGKRNPVLNNYVQPPTMVRQKILLFILFFLTILTAVFVPFTLRGTCLKGDNSVVYVSQVCFNERQRAHCWT